MGIVSCRVVLVSIHQRRLGAAERREDGREASTAVPSRGAWRAIRPRREDVRGHARTVSPCLWRGPEAAPTHGARGGEGLAEDESHMGGKEGWPGGSGGRGSRRRGPWPHSGQRVISVPVHCHRHAATLLTGPAGGAGGWLSRGRHWRRARALHRLARTPIWRMRGKPCGTTCKRKRRMHACASSPIAGLLGQGFGMGQFKPLQRLIVRLPLIWWQIRFPRSSPH
jgi:hypothetical protein